MAALNEIRCNKTTIQEILGCEDFNLILTKVFENKLITKREYNNLKHITNGNYEEYATRLVDKIMNKDEDHRKGFLLLLQTDDDIQATFSALKEIKWNRPPPSTEVPGASIQESSATDTGQDDSIPKSKRCKEDEYQLTSKPTGIMLILNNENFIRSYTRRKGTNKDADDLATVFKWLGFRVLMCKDQTKSEMAEVLKEFASLTDLSKLQQCKVKEWSGTEFSDLQELPKHGDAFVCCILSHGEKGGVCGTDSELLILNEITTPFDGSHCSVLINKPKVFFIQACQGREKHKGVKPDGATPEDESDAKPPISYIPVSADFLVIISSVEGYVSYRHEVTGSWFIQSLCKQLKETCPRGDDITTIITRVNNDVSQKEGNSSAPGKVKQMPEARNFTLRKKLVFTPCTN